MRTSCRLESPFKVRSMQLQGDGYSPFDAEVCVRVAERGVIYDQEECAAEKTGLHS